jgi:HEAT repeats
MRFLVAALALSIVIALPPVAQADEAEKPIALVAPFSVAMKIRSEDPTIGTDISDLVTAHLEPFFRTPEPAEVKRAEKETEISLKDLFTSLLGCGKLGREVKAARIVTGKLARFGEEYVLHLRVVEVPGSGPGRVIATGIKEFGELESIPEMIPALLKSAGLLSAVPRPVVAVPLPAEVDIETLVARLTSPDAGVRFTSAVELGRSGKKEAGAALIRVMREDSDVFVRRAAARSLGELGVRDAVPALIGVLGDKDFFVAISANQAILNITRHDCGLKDGMTPSDMKRIVEDARQWWKEEND